MVLVGSVEAAADVDDAVVDAAVDAVPVVEVPDVADVLAWRSTNSFCRAALKLEALLPVEPTALVLPLLAVLDEVASGDDGSNEVLLVAVLLLLPVTL